MYLDERGYTVLKTIVNNPSITGKEVEASLQLTRKQLSYAIEKINDYLQGNGMPKIERLRTGKFIVPVMVLEQYKTEDMDGFDTTYVYSDKDRGFLIYLMLLCIQEELSIYHFTSELEISKNTFLTDLKKLEHKLEVFHLEVSYNRQEGYHLVGSEFAKREMMIEAVRGILKLPNGKDTIMGICRISEELMTLVEEQIAWIEERLKIRFTDERMKEIGGYLNRIEETLYGASDDKDALYKDFIDMDAFIDWWIVHELTQNAEPNGPRSCYMYKVEDGLLKAGPVWDFDLAFITVGLDVGGDIRPSRLNRPDVVTLTGDSIFNKNALWYDRLLEEPTFANRLKERWETLEPKFLSLLDELDNWQKQIEPSALADEQLWKGQDPARFDTFADWKSSVRNLREVYRYRINSLHYLLLNKK